MKTRTVLVLLTYMASSIALAQTEVPNTFQSGQPALADQVNDNFTTLETAVNNNAASISAAEADILANTASVAANAMGISDNAALIATNTAAIQVNTDAIGSLPVALVPMVKANGQNIGAFLYSTGGAGIFFDAAFFWVMSDTGYVFAVTPIASSPSPVSTGIPGELQRHTIYFANNDCTGQAYVAANQPGRAALYQSGAVFASRDGSNATAIYYSAMGSTTESGATLQSRIEESGCIAEVSATDPVIKAFPNDPLITGAPSSRNFAPPITIGR